MNKFKGYRTVIWNGTMATLSFIIAIDAVGLTDLGIPTGTAAWLVFGSHIINIWLRTITNTPIGQQS